MIPAGPELSIVNGFAEGPDNKLSPQLDTMLVVGKNLYGADLDDALMKMRAVNDLYGAFMQTGDEKFNITPARAAIARLSLCGGMRSSPGKRSAAARCNRPCLIDGSGSDVVR